MGCPKLPYLPAEVPTRRHGSDQKTTPFIGVWNRRNTPKEHKEWYDFGFRNYDAALGRWFNVDPLAESMGTVSPYNYCFNDPINFVDPLGLDPVYIDPSNRKWKRKYAESGKHGYYYDEDLGRVMKPHEVTYFWEHGYYQWDEPPMVILDEVVIEDNGQNGGDTGSISGNGWFSDHYYFEAGAMSTFGAQVSIVPSPEGGITIAPYIRGQAGAYINLGSVTLVDASVDLENGPKINSDITYKEFTQGFGLSIPIIAQSGEYERKITPNGKVNHKFTFTALYGLLGVEYNSSTDEFSVGIMPSAKWAAGVGVKGYINAGLKFKR